MLKTRYIICFEFLGENFFGSQKQPDKRTVQEEIEKALCTLTKDKINITISGRTDAKVSAKFQCAHFDLADKIENEYRFIYSLNSILPEDIRVFEIRNVENTFHAQKDAKYKHYRYTILNSHVASAFSNRYLHFPYKVLNIKRINESLEYLIGHHDFSSFKSSSNNPYNDCMIYYARAQKALIDRYDFIFIDIIGNRFLYNMVRTIIGQLLFIEKKELKPSAMKEVLELKDRKQAAQVEIASPLCLEYVGYDNVFDYIEKMNL